MGKNNWFVNYSIYFKGFQIFHLFKWSFEVIMASMGFRGILRYFFWILTNLRDFEGFVSFVKDFILFKVCNEFYRTLRVSKWFIRISTISWDLNDTREFLFISEWFKKFRRLSIFYVPKGFFKDHRIQKTDSKEF